MTRSFFALVGKLFTESATTAPTVTPAPAAPQKAVRIPGVVKDAELAAGVLGEATTELNAEIELVRQETAAELKVQALVRQAGANFVRVKTLHERAVETLEKSREALAAAQDGTIAAEEQLQNLIFGLTPNDEAEKQFPAPGAVSATPATQAAPAAVAQPAPTPEPAKEAVVPQQQQPAPVPAQNPPASARVDVIGDLSGLSAAERAACMD
jgi:hypothetical protein